MTTAHRPTWNSVVGGSEQGGNRTVVPTRQFSSKDLPGYLTLKTRPNNFESREVYIDTLLEKERISKDLALTDSFDIPSSNYDAKKSEQNLDHTIPKLVLNPNLQDVDDEDFMASSISESEESNSSDSEDDEALLRKEVERLKREKERDERQREEERFKKMTKDEQFEKIASNPILAAELNTDYSLRKRWFEDTVFKNQSRKQEEEKKRFINDTVRSDFHKKFLSKFIFTQLQNGFNEIMSFHFLIEGNSFNESKIQLITSLAFIKVIIHFSESVVRFTINQPTIFFIFSDWINFLKNVWLQIENQHYLNKLLI